MKKRLFFFSVIASAMMSGAVVCADSRVTEKISFSCRYGDNGVLVCADGNDKDTYYVSMNGGVNFIPMTDRKLYFENLPENDFQFCVMKNNDKSTLSDIMAIHTGKNYTDVDEDIPILCEGIRENTFRGGAVKVTIKNFSLNKNYMVTVNGGMTWHPMKTKTTKITGLYSGNYKVMVRTMGDDPKTSRLIKLKVPEKIRSERVILRAPLIKQLPDLPTGCEVTSLAMAINYYGIKIKNTVLADNFLEKAPYQTADFREKFVGDPREVKAYGCYSGVIVNCAEKFLGTISGRDFETVDLTGCKPDMLYKYVNMGYPVIVWGTNRMVPTTQGATWTDLASGKKVTWLGNEHCMLLTGYDSKRGYVYLNDPMYGGVSYSMDIFEERFEELENQAVLIVETTKK